MPDIYEFLDYRTFLSQYYNEQKKADSHFSYQVFAEMAGFKARDFLYRVMKGQKQLSAASIPKLSVGLNLSGNRSRYFNLLVKFTQAKTNADRDALYSHLCAANPRLRQLRDTRIIPHEQYRLYCEWYHVAIRSIIEMHGFAGDWQWLAAQLSPPITPFQAKKSVALLEKLGLVSCSGNGSYKVRDQSIATGEDVKLHALHSFYQWGFKRAAEVLEECPREQRNISGITLGISAKTYKKAVEKIQALRQELAQLAREDAEADRVYQCNFQLFPMSQCSNKSSNELNEDNP